MRADARGPLLPFDEALDRLLGSVTPLGAERVGLDAAQGRYLAEDLIARAPMPGFDYSSMDGYAIATRDFEGEGPWSFPVTSESAAGGETPALAPRATCRIFTGAPIPEGADAVVMQENVARTDGAATFTTRPRAGDHIRRRGSDLAEGAPALARGTRLDAGKIALAAALDRPFVRVARRPKVTVLCSGDELRSPGEPGRVGSIAESNGFFVRVAAQARGADASVAPYVADDLRIATRAVEDALRASDLVVTIGGVSVGDRDVMKEALEAAGVTIDFWRVKIKPGKPLAVGRAGVTHVLGLPGNPASASLTFLLFGAPLLRALQGDRAPRARWTRATIAGALTRSAGRQEFARARLLEGAEGLVAEILPNQASGAVTSFAEADGLVAIDAERTEVRAGERLPAIRLADL